jgi:hypothetical protein
MQRYLCLCGTKMSNNSRSIANFFVLMVMAMSFATSSAFAEETFGSFSAEAARLGKLVQCPRPKTTPAGSGMGALFGCVMGRAQTAKLFVNESRSRSGVVENVKVMWNDWFKDAGFGLHADKDEASKIVGAVAGLYAPQSKTELTAAFLGGTSATIEEGRFTLVVRVTRGPEIDERLLIITEK